MRRVTDHSFRKAFFVLTLAMTCQLVLAQRTECAVGVNVNGFQNFSAADQQVIAEQLKQSGVRFVRTSLRADDKNVALAKTLQSEGIGLVLVSGVQFSPNAKLRPADEKQHIRSAMPLSSADPQEFPRLLPDHLRQARRKRSRTGRG